jgi:hypothetical protein
MGGVSSFLPPHRGFRATVITQRTGPGLLASRDCFRMRFQRQTVNVQMPHVGLCDRIAADTGAQNDRGQSEKAEPRGFGDHRCPLPLA